MSSRQPVFAFLARLLWCRLLIASFALALLVSCNSQSSTDQRAAEGHGALPRPSAMSENRGGMRPRHALAPQDSGIFSRIVFETNEGPDFKVEVRDLSLPPGATTSTRSQSQTTVLEMLTDRGMVKIGGQSAEWQQEGDIVVPPGVPIELQNPTERELLVRLYLVEAKR